MNSNRCSVPSCADSFLIYLQGCDKAPKQQTLISQKSWLDNTIVSTAFCRWHLCGWDVWQGWSHKSYAGSNVTLRLTSRLWYGSGAPNYALQALSFPLFTDQMKLTTLGQEQCVTMHLYNHSHFFHFFFPQLALAIGVLTSSSGVRVRRFCGFVAGGAVTQGVVGGVIWCVYGCGFAGRFHSFSYRGSYFKLGGDGSQILWIRCGGAVTQGVVGGVVWCVEGSGFADPRPVCRHTECHWSCHLMRVGVRVYRSKRGLSQKVSLEVSSDACTGGGAQDYFLFKFLFLFRYILYLYFGLFLAMEEDVSCESAWKKLQKIADTFPCYLGSMLV